VAEHGLRQGLSGSCPPKVDREVSPSRAGGCRR
jgi:hypothetical protein